MDLHLHYIHTIHTFHYITFKLTFTFTRHTAHTIHTFHYIALHYIALHGIGITLTFRFRFRLRLTLTFTFTLHGTQFHLHYITLHLSLNLHLHYIAKHTHTYIHYITLHYVTLRYITLHYIALHYIALHYITLHYITLHYITLHTYIHTYIRISLDIHTYPILWMFSPSCRVWLFERRIVPYSIATLVAILNGTNPQLKTMPASCQSHLLSGSTVAKTWCFPHWYFTFLKFRHFINQQMCLSSFCLQYSNYDILRINPPVWDKAKSHIIGLKRYICIPLYLHRNGKLPPSLLAKSKIETPFQTSRNSQLGVAGDPKTTRTARACAGLQAGHW